MRDDMISQRFGWLIVDLPSSRRTSHGGGYWLCDCLCGARLEIIGDNLRSGNTVSCGCLRRRVPAARRLLAALQRDRQATHSDPLVVSLARAWAAGLTIQSMAWRARTYTSHCIAPITSDRQSYPSCAWRKKHGWVDVCKRY